ncbi:Mu transposase domain-containing protein [Streptomyces calvus]|uniref:Mu transposase domain-containing protein n=1 Tax=Streptomyces calvus TaxID=67282 RepID=UPI0037122528
MLGGVPCGKVRYGNLRAAVARVLGLSRARVGNDRWTAFRSHYGIESMYCRTGLEGAHEKGAVEGQIGWFRRNHLVPLPEVDSRAELNSMVERWDAENDDRRIRQRPRAVGEYFAVERPLLQPLPDEPFETGRLFSLRVDRYAQVSVRTNRYSVPVGLIGRTVRVMLYASEVVVCNGRKEVARHERLTAKGQSRLGLDHYLEALVRKPGAFPGATALEQARSAGKLTPSTVRDGQSVANASLSYGGHRYPVEVISPRVWPYHPPAPPGPDTPSTGQPSTNVPTPDTLMRLKVAPLNSGPRRRLPRTGNRG